MSLSLDCQSHADYSSIDYTSVDPESSSRELHTIRLRGSEWGGEDKTVTVKLVESDGQRTAAGSLINRMYSWRGYGDDHHVNHSAGRTTFSAHDGGDVIGTVTLGVDSADGLAVDKTFSEEIDSFRAAPGARICELTKLAFDTDVPSKPLLASFFHIIFIYGQRRHNCTDLFIEVNPRHRRFYETMLGFRRIGGPKLNEKVGAPAQLMWLKVSDIRAKIDQHAGCFSQTSRSLYPYFFSESDERGIYARLGGGLPPPRSNPISHLDQARRRFDIEQARPWSQ